MAEQESGYSAGSLLLTFFLGGLVGAGIVLLVAPKTGRETRNMIKGFAGDAREKAEGYIEQVKEKTESIIEKGKDFLEKEKSIIASAVEAGKEAYEREKNKP